MLASAFFFALLVSLLTSILIVTTQRLHGHLSNDSHTGVQKLHKAPTPRIGGIAVLAGAVVGGLNMPAAHQALWWVICAAALPAFLAGLLEDVTKRVGVRTRLLATMFAGLLFCFATGYRIERVDLPGIDWLLSFYLPSLVLTVFAIGGIANAINIIDGVNGLASGTAIIVLSGFGVVAWQVGDQATATACVVGIGAIGGFFILNYPLGRIFFGDAGAYTTGFLLAAIAVMLPARNPDLSPLVGLLALAYPVTETIVSIHRRMRREGTHPGQADRLHLHSLVYRNLARRFSEALGVPRLRNALTSTLIWSLPAFSAALMVSASASSTMMWVGLVCVFAVYLVAYRKLALMGWFARAGGQWRSTRAKIA